MFHDFLAALPTWLQHGSFLGLRGWQWLGLLCVLGVASALARVLERVLLAVATRVVRLTRFQWDDVLVESGAGPLAVLLWAWLYGAGTRLLDLTLPALQRLDVAGHSLVILAFAWYLLRLLERGAEGLRASLAASKGGAFRANRLLTQLTVSRRVLEIVIWVVAAAVLLMQFEAVRNVGVSLLASAGIAGLVLGLAAQKSISTLLAGIQLTLTQPIQIGDQVVVEGENGTIEEITLSYVVVRVWDNRRLVVPITQFLEKPFQNWSKGPAEQLGTVNLQADYAADVAGVRAELSRILEGPGKALWDGKSALVHVTETSERTMTVRVLLSASTSNLWELRCLVREHLVRFLRASDWLPRTRPEPSPPDPKGRE